MPQPEPQSPHPTHPQRRGASWSVKSKRPATWVMRALQQGAAITGKERARIRNVGLHDAVRDDFPIKRFCHSGINSSLLTFLCSRSVCTGVRGAADFSPWPQSQALKAVALSFPVLQGPPGLCSLNKTASAGHRTGARMCWEISASALARTTVQLAPQGGGAPVGV